MTAERSGPAPGPVVMATGARTARPAAAAARGPRPQTMQN